MGGDGLRRATEVAVLAANYLATRLRDAYPVLYTGPGGLVAHECILDLREITKQTGRHRRGRRQAAHRLRLPRARRCRSPWRARSWSSRPSREDLAELDRFVEAMMAIRAEIDDVAAGRWAVEDSPLRHAPHTAVSVTADDLGAPVPA